MEGSEVPLSYSARIWKLCSPLARLPMANERAVGRWVLWVIQPAPGAWEASENDCRPDEVPTAQSSVTDEHDGMAERLTVPTGGAVVVVVVETGGSSSSSVVTDSVWSATLS